MSLVLKQPLEIWTGFDDMAKHSMNLHVSDCFYFQNPEQLSDVGLEFTKCKIEHLKKSAEKQLFERCVETQLWTCLERNVYEIEVFHK